MSGHHTGHVVYVCLDPGVPVFGRKGCSVHVQEVLREMVSRGLHVDLVAARTGGPLPSGLADITVHELGRPKAATDAELERLLIEADEDAATLVAKLISAEEADTVVYQRFSLWSCAVLQAAVGAGATTVLEVNSPLVEEQARHRVLVDADGARRRAALALTAADLPFAVSGPVADWATALCRRPVLVVPNGVDPGRFPPRAPGVAEQDCLTVAFVGTFRPWHGLELLLDAVASLGELDGLPLRLLLVGDGPGRADVLDRAEAAGLDVEAPGAVDPAEVARLLAGADVAVAPYPAGETYFSPLKVMEYLAAGVATVSGAVTDLPRLFAAGEEVLLVPPGDVPALAGALQRLRTDAGLRERLGRAGAAAVRQRHTWSSVVSTVLDAAGHVRTGPRTQWVA
jgi:glycosyltransferase involved in cell wall biosynthesis